MDIEKDTPIKVIVPCSMIAVFMIFVICVCCTRAASNNTKSTHNGNIFSVTSSWNSNSTDIGMSSWDSGGDGGCDGGYDGDCGGSCGGCD